MQRAMMQCNQYMQRGEFSKVVETGKAVIDDLRSTVGDKSLYEAIVAQTIVQACELMRDTENTEKYLVVCAEALLNNEEEVGTDTIINLADRLGTSLTSLAHTHTLSLSPSY